eukprot:96535-Rhodomonas_salina.1
MSGTELGYGGMASGALTQAVEQGRWVLIEDIDTAPLEVSAYMCAAYVCAAYMCGARMCGAYMCAAYVCAAYVRC